MKKCDKYVENGAKNVEEWLICNSEGKIISLVVKGDYCCEVDCLVLTQGDGDIQTDDGYFAIPNMVKYIGKEDYEILHTFEGFNKAYVDKMLEYNKHIVIEPKQEDGEYVKATYTCGKMFYGFYHKTLIEALKRFNYTVEKCSEEEFTENKDNVLDISIIDFII